MMKRFFVFLLFCFFHIVVKAQLDLEHWFPPIFSSGANVTNVFLSLSTDKDAPFKVYIYDGNRIVDTVTLDKAHPLEYNLGSGGNILSVYTNSIGDTMKPLDRGLHLVGEKSFYANLKLVGSKSEIISSKGKSALGNSFFIVNDQNLLAGNNPVPMNYQASITAYHDNTKIKVSNLKKPLVFADGIKWDELDIVLNKNQTFIIAALKKDNTNNDFNDYPDPTLIGASISADKPIVVTNGNVLSQDASEEGGSINIDQSMPIDKIGKEYLLVNGMAGGNLYMEKALIVATEDDTKVFFNNENTPLFVLNKGQHYIGPYQSDKKFIDSSQPSFTNEEGRLIPTSAMYIKATKPIYCYQLIATFYDKPIDPRQYVYKVGATSAMLFSYPLDKEYQNKNVLIAFVDKIGNDEMRSKISIKTEKSATVKVNNNILTNGSDIIGKPGWVYYTIQNSKGNVDIFSDKSLNVDFVGGTTNAYSSSYSGYAASVVSKSNDPYITLNGNCIEEGLLLTLNNIFFDKIQWQKDGVDIVGANQSTYAPIEEGLYTCVVTYSNLTYTTNSFNVVHCPYTVIEKDFGNICDKISFTPKFSSPNESQTVSKLEILANPFGGVLNFKNLDLEYIPTENFVGTDRFVYRICTASLGLCETIKANIYVNEKPSGEIKKELYPISEANGKGLYNLLEVIINNNNQYEFYEDAGLTILVNSPNRYETKLLKIYVKISSLSGCYVIREVNLLTLQDNISLSNFFSPNNDGINDYWDYSKLKDYSDLKLTIYNKLGYKVFEHSAGSQNYTWDGKNSTGNALATDTYWCLMEWKNTRTGNKVTKQMWILLKARN